MLLPANHANGCEAKVVSRSGGSADVIRISTTKREKDLMALLPRDLKIVLKRLFEVNRDRVAADDGA